MELKDVNELQFKHAMVLACKNWFGRKDIDVYQDIIGDHVYVKPEHITIGDVFHWLNKISMEIWKGSIEEFNDYSVNIITRNKLLFKTDCVVELYIDVFVSILSNAKISDILFWDVWVEDKVRKIYNLKSHDEIDKEMKNLQLETIDN